MANKQPAKLSKPGVGAFDYPAALVAPELSAVLVFSLLVVVTVRDDEVDASLLKPLAQRIGVVGSVGDHAVGLLSRPAFWSWDFDFGERGFRKRNFSWRGTFKPNSQRKTATVDQYHPLRPLAGAWFSRRRRPLFGRGKAAVQESVFPVKQALADQRTHHRLPRGEPHALLFPPLQPSPASRRQRILSGKNLHAAPVCNTHRMPSKQARLEAQGRPRLSLRRFGAGSSGAINSHCASLNNSNRFLPMQEENQPTRLTQSLQLEADPIYETRSRNV